jgi:hypothetical protein
MWRRIITSAFSLSLLFSGRANADPDIFNAKAAELNCHRIEKLVILKKIHEHFLSGFSTISLTTLQAPNPGDPKFKITSGIEPGPDGTVDKLEVTLDSIGKPLSFSVVAGTPAALPTQWPDKDPVTLTENSLHFVLENYEKIPAIASYYTSLQQLKIYKGKNTAGEDVAVVDIEVAATDPILRIRVKFNGDFESWELISR